MSEHRAFGHHPITSTEPLDSLKEQAESSGVWGEEGVGPLRLEQAERSIGGVDTDGPRLPSLVFFLLQLTLQSQRQ